MSISYRQAHAMSKTHEKLRQEVSAMKQEAVVAIDLATVDFRNAADDILSLSDGELRRRLPEFGPALSALIKRVATLGAAS